MLVRYQSVVHEKKYTTSRNEICWQNPEDNVVKASKQHNGNTRFWYYNASKPPRWESTKHFEDRLVQVKRIVLKINFNEKVRLCDFASLANHKVKS